jgi:hypothetical protein
MRLLLLAFCLSLSGGAEVAGASVAQVKRETPIELLHRMYENSNILVLATSNHEEKTPYLLIQELLERVGEDPRLKLIAFEAEHDAEPLYEHLLGLEKTPAGAVEAEQALLNFHSDSAMMREKVCSPERAFILRDFTPVLREINARRAPKNRVRMVPLDGMSLFRHRLWPLGDGNGHGGLGGEIRFTESACEYRNAPSKAYYVVSSNREEDIAARFVARVAGSLKLGEKAIVIYHYSHAIRGFSSCMLGFDPGNPEAWFARQASSSWGELVKKRYPRVGAQMKTVFLDSGAKMSPYVNLKVSERLEEVFPREAWAFDTKWLRESGYAPERGVDALSFSAYMKGVHPYGLQSEAALDEMLDAVIHLPKSYLSSPIGNAAMYYPKLCAYR